MSESQTRTGNQEFQCLNAVENFENVENIENGKTL